METKLVQKFGNSGHIVLPKYYVGKRIKFVAAPKTFNDIKSQVLEILKPYLGSVLGIYLYGSYARNEQSLDSDIDILAVANAKLKIADKIDDFSIISATIKELEYTLENNAVLTLPIIKEAKTIINPVLLEKYKENKFTRENSKSFLDSTAKILELNKMGLELKFEIGSLVYSLILRTRGLLMISLMLHNRLYSKSALFSYLEDNGISQNKVEEFYAVYSKEKNNIKIKGSAVISKEDIAKLLAIAEKLLQEINGMLK